MADPIDAAALYKRQHPEETYTTVSDKFHVPWSSLHNRATGRHQSHKAAAHGKLSPVQETELVRRIVEYGNRGTLLTPGQIGQLAQLICGESIGKNWTSTFLQKHKAELDSKYYAFQDAARAQANTFEHRSRFYALVKQVYDTRLYPAQCRYNMDETGFNPSFEREKRRVAGKGHAMNGQTSPASGLHITVVATIGTSSAPVPPLVIYPGATIQKQYTAIDEVPHLRQVADHTDSGYINGYMMLKWLHQVFDPHTKHNSPAGKRRLLFLDGHRAHVTVDFLEACWALDVVCLCLPASLSHKFQPLDKEFFNHTKREYTDRLDRYILGSGTAAVNKGFFWSWHKEAWQATATRERIETTWKATGLYPLSAEVMRADREETAHTPPPNLVETLPPTPHSIRIIRSNNSLLRTGLIDYQLAYEKTRKALENSLAENVILKHRLEHYEKAAELIRLAKEDRGKQNYPDGEVFDPEYKERYKKEWEAKKKDEKEKAKEKRAAAAAEQKRKAQEMEAMNEAGPSSAV